MKCPICHKETEWLTNPNRPFCSERCKMVDLDHWLSGRYRISSSVAADEEESEWASAPGSEDHIV